MYIRFPLQSPGRVLNVWNANTVPLAGDHPVISRFMEGMAPMTLVDIVSELIHNLGWTVKDILCLLGL